MFDKVIRDHFAATFSDVDFADRLTYLFDNGCWLEAESMVAQACRDQPNQCQRWELLGLLQALLNRHEEAVDSLEHASLLGPISALSMRALSLEYAAIGKVDLSNDLLAEVGKHRKDIPQLVKLISHDLLKAGRADLAVEVLKSSIEYDCSIGLLWHELAAAYSKAGQPSEVTLQCALRALELEPWVIEFRITVATILIQMNQSDDAFEIIRLVSHEMIRQLRCECCVWRLICIYEAYECYDMVRYAYSHIRELHRQQRKTAENRS